MRELTHEQVATFLCHRLGGSGPAWAALHDPPKEAWSLLARQAHRHGVAPALYLRLRSSGEPTAPPSALRLLENAYHVNALRAAAAREQLAEVLQALGAGAIPVAVLKGAHLAEAYYADPAERPFRDLDLLVPSGHLDHAGRVLTRLGYSPDPAPGKDYGACHHTAPLVRAGSLPVELHKRLAKHVEWPGRGIWTRLRNTRVAGVEALALGPEDLLLHLCLHAANHRFTISLLSLLDLSKILDEDGDRLDWMELARRANKAGAGPAMYVALRLVQETLGAYLPTVFCGALKHESTDEEIVAATLELAFQDVPNAPATYRSLIRDQGWRGRMASVKRSVFPCHAALARIYGLPVGSRRLAWLRLARPLHLLLRAAGWWWRLATGASQDRAALRRERIRQRIENWLVQRELAT